MEDVTRVTIDNLHPFSSYDLSVKALPDYKIQPTTKFLIPEEKEIRAATSQGVPNVRPTSSNIPSRVDSTSLTFYWNPALPSQCEFFNADLDGYFYVLKGIEPWNVQEERKGTTFESSMTFSNLMPFSNYLLFVYVHTAQGLYNPDLPFKIPAETQSADKAGTPRALQVSASPEDDQHHLTWLPPYPPTGKKKIGTTKQSFTQKNSLHSF